MDDPTELKAAAANWLIPDDLWEELRHYLPDHPNTHRFGGGRPRRSDRECLNAIFFVLHTGCQWKALDATGLCPGSTAHDRFQEWVAAGVFLDFWTAGLLEYDLRNGIDWDWLSMDGCMTKAPLGGEKDGQKPDGSGQIRGQAQPIGRRGRHPDRVGGGGGEPARLQAGAGDD